MYICLIFNGFLLLLLLLLSRFSHVRLCNPIDGSPPGSTVPGILQARKLEKVAISFSNAWKWKGKVKSLSHVWLFATPRTAAYQAPPSMGFSRQEYWSGVPLPSPLLHCRQILYHWATEEALLLESNKVKQIDPQCGCDSPYQWRDEQKSWLTWTETLALPKSQAFQPSHKN